MLQVFVPLWLLAPVVSLLFSLSLKAEMGSSTYGTSVILIMMSLIFAGVIVALLVMTTILIIQRFYNGLLKEEGYLMFTLPVETWQLITSKGLSAVIVSFVGELIAILSCFILLMASSDDVVLSVLQAWNWFWKSSGINVGPVFWLLVVMALICFLLSTAQSIYQIYAAMAIGHLRQNHRILNSCLAYVVISIIVSLVGDTLSRLIAAVLPDGWYDWVESSASLSIFLYLLLMILVSVVLIVVFHTITERILSKRLNLE
jgi:hypothetical protein